MNWWHWAVLGGLAFCVYYLEKIRDLLGWLMLLQAHRDPKNPVAENFLQEHIETIKMRSKHPATWWLIRWWRQ